jgi:hypothetical protein
MRSLTLRLFGAITAALLLATSLASLVPSVARAQATAGVDPTSGTPGTTFTFFVDGLPADEELEYWITGPGSPEPFERGRFRVELDANGRLNWPWTAPQGVWNGTWTWNVRGVFSNLTATVAFSIEGANGAVVNSGVDPQQGAAGTTFTFFTDGWPDGDVVDYWVLGPGNLQPFALGRIYGDPDEQGRTYWRWKAPPEIYGGTWTMNARGFYSEIQVQIPFQVDGPPPPPPPTSSVSPSSATPGQTLTFNANGFDGGEEIAWWINAPNTTQPVARNGIDELFANGEGAVVFTYTLPLDAMAGQWSAAVRGVESAKEQQIVFTVSGNAGGTPGTPSDTPPPASSGPSVTMSPLSAAAGTTFEFSASGFRRKDTLQYWATGPSGEVVSDNQQIIAETDGSAVWTWRSPATMAVGRWVLSVQAPRTDVKLTIPFEITSNTPGGPNAGVSPGSGAPGTTFSFFAAGLGQEEPVGWWLTSPNGATVQGNPDGRATLEGRYEWSWTAPADAQSGTWQAVLQGKRSGEQRTVSFVVTGDNAAPTPSGPRGTARPTSGAPGTVFEFSAEGLTPEQKLGFWAEAPDGTRYSGEYDLDATRDGTARWTWTAPADVQRGDWTMVLQGKTGRRVVTNETVRIPFTVTP